MTRRVLGRVHVCVCLSKDKTTGGCLLKEAGEPWSGVVVVGVGVCVHVCTNAHIFLKARPHRGVGYWRDQGSPSQLCAHVCVSNGSVPAAGVELWALGLCMSTCQQLGRLGSRGQLLGRLSV